MGAIRTKLTEYQNRYIEKDLTARFTLQKSSDEEEGVMVARTHVEHLDSMNSRTGRWSTEWKIKPGKETEAEVSGTATIHVHYFENGANLQLRSSRQFDKQSASTAEEQVNSIVAQMESRTMSYEEKVANAILAQISSREKELYEQFLVMCDEIDSKLKKIRRILPITKTRFKWDAAAQKQVRLLNARKTS